jgi:hypothetical protein
LLDAVYDSKLAGGLKKALSYRIVEQALQLLSERGKLATIEGERIEAKFEEVKGRLSELEEHDKSILSSGVAFGEVTQTETSGPADVLAPKRSSLRKTKIGDAPKKKNVYINVKQSTTEIYDPRDKPQEVNIIEQTKVESLDEHNLVVLICGQLKAQTEILRGAIDEKVNECKQELTRKIDSEAKTRTEEIQRMEMKILELDQQLQTSSFRAESKSAVMGEWNGEGGPDWNPRATETRQEFQTWEDLYCHFREVPA